MKRYFGSRVKNLKTEICGSIRHLVAHASDLWHRCEIELHSPVVVTYRAGGELKMVKAIVGFDGLTCRPIAVDPSDSPIEVELDELTLEVLALIHEMLEGGKFNVNKKT